MRKRHTILIGKTVKRAARLRGGGTALPGLVVEKLDKNFVGHMLADLPYGVVVITGTNGKTTTTKIVSELLAASGLTVFTNKTGSNFVRGIAAAILDVVDSKGRMPHDIAVLELDEAHAVHFIQRAPVDHVLLLNVMRDQLDRFGEIDYTAKLLQKVAVKATGSVVLNRDDPRVSAIAKLVNLHDPTVPVRYFGADSSLHHVFVNDDKLYQVETEQPLPPRHLEPADVELAAFNEHQASFRIGNKTYDATMKLSGVYNFLNAAGALALCKTILGSKGNDARLVAALEKVEPAFGRGETLQVNGKPLELVLVKNPAGFRLSLASFDPADASVMIAINDQYADGRDMSWLWDVDFTSLQEHGVAMVSGIRAYDMALRLRYDNVAAGQIDTDLRASLATFLSADTTASTRRIFCTYTAMLKLRRLLRAYTKLEIMG